MANPNQGGASDPQVEQQVQEQVGQRKVRLRVDQRDQRTIYANGFRTQFTAEEVIIDFGVNLIDQTSQSAEDNTVNCVFTVGDRLVMNYYSAKRLAISLGQQIKRYEEQFGPLELNVAKRRKSD